MAEKKKQFLFDGLMYDTYGEVTPSGDTLKYAVAHTAKPGQLYKIEYLTKQGLPRANSSLYTKLESGEILPGKLTIISRTSDWGKTIDDTFYPEIMNTPVTKDYSKVGKIKQLLYNFSRKYLENGGKVEKGQTGEKILPKYDKNWLNEYLSLAPDTVSAFGLSGDYIRNKLSDGSYKYFLDPKDGTAYREPLTESEWADNYLRSKGFMPKYDENFENIIGAQTIDRKLFGNVEKRTCGGKVEKSLDGSKMKDISAAIKACGGKMKKKK